MLAERPALRRPRALSRPLERELADAAKAQWTPTAVLVDANGRIASHTAAGDNAIRDLVEKPPLNEAPSDLAIIGRYVLTPDIFPALEATAMLRAQAAADNESLRTGTDAAFRV